LVQLHDVDVRQPEPDLPEKLWYGEHRTDAHLVGLARRDREAAESAERPDAERVRAIGGHDQSHGGAVRELAGVPSRHRPALLERRRKLREALEGGVGSI